MVIVCRPRKMLMTTRTLLGIFRRKTLTFCHFHYWLFVGELFLLIFGLSFLGMKRDQFFVHRF
jgi:hypothetical protein